VKKDGLIGELELMDREAAEKAVLNSTIDFFNENGVSAYHYPILLDYQMPIGNL